MGVAVGVAVDVAVGDIGLAIGVAVGEGSVGVRVGDGATVGVFVSVASVATVGRVKASNRAGSDVAVDSDD